MNKSFFVLFSICAALFSSVARPQSSYNMFFTPVVPTQLNVTATPLSDNVMTSQIVLFPYTGVTNSKIIGSECIGLASPEFNDSSTWLLWPNSGTTKDGINWKLTFNKTSSTTSGPELANLSGGPINHTLMNFAWSRRPDKNAYCGPIGHQIELSYKSSESIAGTLTIDPKTAVPGRYTIPILLRWALEDNKFSGGYGGSLWKNAGSILTNGVRLEQNFEVIINSKCDFDGLGAGKVILLDHGDIVLSKDKDLYLSQGAKFKVSCSTPASVSVALIGAKPITQKTSNFTDCQKGTCELLFDSGELIEKYNEVIKMHANEQRVFQVKSIFRPSNVASAGSFTGAGVLQVFIQ